MVNNTSYSDKELLLRIAEGDEAAFRGIVMRYKNKLTAFVLNMTRSSEIAEEVVQDSFVQVWIIREGLGKVDDFSKFLFILCRNQAINAFRKSLRDREKQRQLEVEYVPEIKKELPYDEVVFANLLDKALSNLTPKQKMAWDMSRRSGMKHAEIAEKMLISKETVKKHIQYANASIIEFLKEKKDYLLWLSWIIYNR